MKHSLQRLPVALAQVKAGNISENLLDQVRSKIYSLCQSKEITKINQRSQYNEIAFSGTTLKKLHSDINNGYYIYELKK